MKIISLTLTEEEHKALLKAVSLGIKNQEHYLMVNPESEDIERESLDEMRKVYSTIKHV